MDCSCKAVQPLRKPAGESVAMMPIARFGSGAILETILAPNLAYVTLAVAWSARASASMTCWFWLVSVSRMAQSQRPLAWKRDGGAVGSA